MEVDLQKQYDAIWMYFRTTTEPYDELDWDGENLLVLLDDKVIEKYSYEDLKKITDGKDRAWAKIFETYNLYDYDFDASPFSITSKQINAATREFTSPIEREVRILCKQDTRESRPRIFQERGLFILPTKNGIYSIIKGEGYMDIPPPTEIIEIYNSQLNFPLDTAKIGNSEMQHLDFAYASSLIRTFLEDKSLVLTIRGRKYTPSFNFFVGKHSIQTKSVQTEVDGGYEGRKQVTLIEAKATGHRNTIIRQLYYPFRQWQSFTSKNVITVFFEKFGDVYSLWQFQFRNELDYNSIELVKSQSFSIKERF